MRLRIKALLLSSIVFSLAFAPIAAWACGGGFFGPADAAVYPNVTRVVFGVNKAEGTITEIVGINYTGSAADFSWVMPLPSAPKLDVAKTSDLDYLEDATSLSFSYGTNYCANLNSAQVIGLGGGGGGGADEIGPYNYNIIKNTSPDDLVKWLKTNGYNVPAEALPVIADYVKAGDVFLAMRLKPGADVQDIQPIVMTYKADKPTFPIRLGGVTHNGNTDSESILTWIFADTQYKSDNYASSSLPDFSGTRSENEVTNIGSPDVFFNPSAAPRALYDAARSQVQAKYNGQAFITEYAQPLTPSAPNQSSDDLVTKLFNSYHYLTRLSARLSANQETLDPVFVSAPKAQDVSPYIDISEKVDPLILHGCSTQTAVSPRVAAEFAKSHARFADMNFTVGYPSTWVLSEITVTPTFTGDKQVIPQYQTPEFPVNLYIYAPQPVTNVTLDAYFKGQPTPPMFVFASLVLADSEALLFTDRADSIELGNTNPALPELLLQALGRDTLTDHFPVTSAHLAGQNIIRVSGPPNLGYTDSDPTIQPPPVSVVLFGMLATDSDWQANGALYKDMLDYAQAHLYALDANTRDTLFLSASTGDDINTPVVSDIFSLPIPDGWSAHTDTNGDVVLAPTNALADSGPTMRLSIVGGIGDAPFRLRFDGMVLAGTQAASDPRQRADLLKNAARPLTLYGFSTTPIDPSTQSALTQCPTDPTTVKAAMFKHNGLTGQVALTTDYIAAVYAPDAQYAQYKDTLQTLMNAYLAGYNCQKAPANANAAPDNTGVFSCPTAPPVRLQMLGEGRVTPGAPDNLREAPDLTSPVVGMIKAGETFSTLEGPICDPKAGIVWWKIEYQTPTGGKLIGWIAEGQGSTYFVEPVK